MCRSSLFGREQRAVLAGMVRYAQDRATPAESVAVLRRNTHRLEKGLLMRPRRPVFALDYIEETVVCYERAIAASRSVERYCEEELHWAFDVLTEYFKAVESHPRVDPLRDRFRQLTTPKWQNGGRYVPYLRNLAVPLPVDYDSLLSLSRRRRSVRWFLPNSVPRELIDQAVELAALSPSACNRQPFVFRIVDDPSMVRSVAAIPYGTAGYEENIPAIVVVVGRLRCYFDERDRHLIYIDGALASMSFLYALETLGLSSCCINWPELADRETEMARVLQLAPDERPIMLIALGYPDPEGMVAYSCKKPLETLRRYNLE